MAPEVILPDLQDPTERAAEALTTDLPARILRFLLKNPLLLLAPILLVAALVFWLRSRQPPPTNQPAD